MQPDGNGDGARVTLNGVTKTVGVSGSCEFENVPVGKQIITVEKEGFVTVNKEVFLEVGEYWYEYFVINLTPI